MHHLSQKVGTSFSLDFSGSTTEAHHYRNKVNLIVKSVALLNGNFHVKVPIFMLGYPQGIQCNFHIYLYSDDIFMKVLLSKCIQFNLFIELSIILIPRSLYRAITTIALIVSDRDIQAKTKI